MTGHWWEKDEAAFADLVAGLVHLSRPTNGDVRADYERYLHALQRFAPGYCSAPNADGTPNADARQINALVRDMAEAQRNAPEVSRTLPVLQEFALRMLEKPHVRLAVYGTLRKGKSNHRYIADLGDATDGFVTGSIDYRDSYPVLRWHPDGGTIPVEVYSSARLTVEKWAALDEFEGHEYRRLFIPVSDATSGERIVATIYADARS